MKFLIVFAALVALTVAAPKPLKHIGFRNLYIEATNGKPHPNPRIIGGQEAKPHSIPWQGFIEAESLLEGWYCGASLISENHVLTAAHCLQDEFGLVADIAKVTLGAHKVLEQEDTQVIIEVEGEGVIPNPDYDSSSFVNDLGILTLPQAVTLNENIAAVPLPTSADNDYAGSPATISGWGITEGHSQSLSQVLNVLETEIIANDECNQQLGGDYVKSNNICTSGAKSTGTCSGDSGGPLTVEGVQVGIVSFGIVNCPAGYPSAYTRVTEYLDWIKENTA